MKFVSSYNQKFQNYRHGWIQMLKCYHKESLHLLVLLFPCSIKIVITASELRPSSWVIIVTKRAPQPYQQRMMESVSETWKMCPSLKNHTVNIWSESPSPVLDHVIISIPGDKPHPIAKSVSCGSPKEKWGSTIRKGEVDSGGLKVDVLIDKNEILGVNFLLLW